MVRMKEIAVQAGVSVSTVSRALSNQSTIPPDTRERMQSIAREMGCRPNPFVATLMTGTRDRQPPPGANLACLQGETARTEIFPMHREFLDGMQAAAGRLNYTIDHFQKRQSMIHNLAQPT